MHAVAAIVGRDQLVGLGRVFHDGVEVEYRVEACALLDVVVDLASDFALGVVQESSG